MSSYRQFKYKKLIEDFQRKEGLQEKSGLLDINNYFYDQYQLTRDVGEAIVRTADNFDLNYHEVYDICYPYVSSSEQIEMKRCRSYLHMDKR